MNPIIETTIRPLTTDDYITAAKIVSSCPRDRLEIVLNLLAKGGFDTTDSRLFLRASDGLRGVGSQIKAAKEARKFTWQQMSDKLGIARDVLRAYAEGKRFPSASRYMEIVNKLIELESEDELLQQ